MKVDIEVHLFEPATGLRGVETSDHWGHDKNPTTGEPYPPTPIDELISAIIWWWDEGNGGCICNRAMALDRAAGKFTKQEDYCCTMDRKVIIEKLFVNGGLVYEEENDGSRKEDTTVILEMNGVRKEVPVSRLSEEIENLSGENHP